MKREYQKPEVEVVELVTEVVTTNSDFVEDSEMGDESSEFE